MLVAHKKIEALTCLCIVAQQLASSTTVTTDQSKMASTTQYDTATTQCDTTAKWLAVMAAAKRDDAAKLKALAAELEADAAELAAEAADLKDTLQKIEATQKATALMKAEAASVNAQAAKLEATTAKVNAKQQTLDEMLEATAGAAAACYTRCCSDGATADTATAVADAAELLLLATKRNRLLVAAEIETDPAASYKLEWRAGFY